MKLIEHVKRLKGSLSKEADTNSPSELQPDKVFHTYLKCFKEAYKCRKNVIK